jgi:hypothetical protein
LSISDIFVITSKFIKTLDDLKQQPFHVALAHGLGGVSMKPPPLGLLYIEIFICHSYLKCERNVANFPFPVATR